MSASSNQPARGAIADAAAWLSGARVATAETPSERAEQLLVVAREMRQLSTPFAGSVADVFEDWLRSGGDLQKMLGLRPRSGGAFEQAHRAKQFKTRNEAICALGARIEGSLKARAVRLALMLEQDHPDVLVLRQEHVGVPTSARQLVRILRAPGRRVT